jgi:hypothetical protein
VQAVKLLDDVLLRMQAHQNKKTPRLRALRSWEELSAIGPAVGVQTRPAQTDRVGAEDLV